MRKPFKTIKTDNGEISLYGNHHWKELWYAVPEWNKDKTNPEMEACFNYLGERYFLSEFMRVDANSPFYELGGITFHGYHSDSFFSGILIHYSDCDEAVQVYTYIS